MTRSGTWLPTRCVLLPCPVLLLSVLLSCAPQPLTGPVPATGADPSDMGSRSMGMVPGRVYVLGQVLARERQQRVELQEELDRRAQEMERLQSEVAALHQREGELRAALDQVLAKAGAGGAPAAAATQVTTDANTAPRGEAEQAGMAAVAAAVERGQRQAEAQSAATIAALRSALTQEQQRREHVETELARLKEETSAPPYGQDRASEAEQVAAKQEITQLRAALEDERSARERLAQDFRALQEREASERAAAETRSGANAEMQSRLQQLQEEKQNITQSFNRSLAQSQDRVVDLERQLALARTAAGPDASDGAAASIRAENTALRARLDEEHRRTEELAAKLKVAMRVTDLIFKMQAQQAPPKR